MPLLTFRKDADANLSPHFNVSEFKCPCPQCTETKIDTDLIARLETLRAQTGPLKINSGYRCEHYQDELRLRGYETAVGVSQHTLGRAADVAGADTQFAGAELARMARIAGFKAVGVARTWVHLDLRGQDDGKIRTWTYTR